LVHRDLKPTNVLLAADGPRVIDFGVVRALDGIALTTGGVTFGTPSYMSPEQAEGRSAGPASDVFALGSTLCFAATGGTPFGDGDPPAVLRRVVHTAPALDGVPGELRGLIAACLAKNPADRPGLPEILRACQAHAPQPGDPDYGSASFWPAQVAALIAAHQVGPDGVAPAREPDGEPTSGARPLAVLGTLPPAAPRTARPRDRRPTDPLPHAVSRRRALAGLAVVSAAGLGAAGWALTRAGGAKPAAADTPSRLLWARGTGGPVSSGAAIAGGVLYIGGADGVHALDATSGRPVTKTYPTGGAVQGAVTVAGATLLAGSDDNRVHAWSVAFGGSSWKHTTGGPVRGRPAVVNGVVYAGSDDHYVYALDAGTGLVNWRYRTGGPVRSSPQPTEVSYNDFIYVGSDDGYLYALDPGKQKPGWRYNTRGAVESAPATDSGGAVYAGNNRGDVYEMDGPPADGVWKFQGRGAIQGTPATDGAGTLYAGSADGFVYAVSLSSGVQIWAYRAGGPVRSGLALAGGILYAGCDDGYLYAINVTTGKPAWQYRAGGAIRSRILVAASVIYFGSLDHRVYALRA
jgi:outer membrane protein assembly factor BamB